MSRLIDADKLKAHYAWWNDENKEIFDQIVDQMPTVDLVTCKDCKWWDKKDESPYGYCHACKHGYMSKHWEISIYRTYKGDWYCADGERKEDDEADRR